MCTLFNPFDYNVIGSAIDNEIALGKMFRVLPGNLQTQIIPTMKSFQNILREVYLTNMSTCRTCSTDSTRTTLIFFPQSIVWFVYIRYILVDLIVKLNHHWTVCIILLIDFVEITRVELIESDAYGLLVLDC